ncbi:hypothetical protein CspHIS471_0200650 [Cutaneotrichosporon sp. HIS471]|nr:hypothetical protein CspHIS471_0200650 [Cutaneotrichosporon sp. HIS471]
MRNNSPDEEPLNPKGKASPSVKSMEPGGPVELLDESSGAPKITLTVPSREALTMVVPSEGGTSSSPSRPVNTTPSHDSPRSSGSSVLSPLDGGIVMFGALESVPEEVVDTTQTVAVVEPQPPTTSKEPNMVAVAQSPTPVKVASPKEMSSPVVAEPLASSQLTSPVEAVAMIKVPEPETKQTPAQLAATIPPSEVTGPVTSPGQPEEDVKPTTEQLAEADNASSQHEGSDVTVVVAVVLNGADGSEDVKPLASAIAAQEVNVVKDPDTDDVASERAKAIVDDVKPTIDSSTELKVSTSEDDPERIPLANPSATPSIEYLDSAPGENPPCVVDLTLSETDDERFSANRVSGVPAESPGGSPGALH